MSIRKIILLSVIAFTAASLFAKAPSQAYWSDEQLKEAGFVKQAKNANLSLYYEKKEAVIAVRINSTGYVWYSSPLDWESDETASGFTKNALPSLLSIRAKDKNGTFRPANSYVNVVKRKGLQFERIDDGIRLGHMFVREGIYIPLDVTIDETSVLFSIPLYEIEEDEDRDNPLKVLDIEINPYFGSAHSDEEGFILVPDGSGAVIKFNNRRSATPYQQYVYGRDPSIIPVKKKTVTQRISLPVFGLSREGAGFISVIESSAARGIINAETSGQVTDFNSVSSSCILRDFDSFSFRERTGTPRSINIFEKTLTENIDETFAVRYIFLDEEKNNLAGMAETYRDYLIEQNKFPYETTEEEPALVINFIGASTKKLPKAGIPVNQDVPFTTFEEARSVIEEYKSRGIENIIVKYDGWINGGILGEYPEKPKPSKELGGNKEFKKLLSYLEENNIPFYGSADFVNLYKQDIKHLKELTVNHAMNHSAVKVPDYRLSTFTDEKNAADSYPYYILRPNVTAEAYRNFMTVLDKKYSDYQIGIAPDSIGNEVSSDFDSKKGTSRNYAAETFRTLLEESSESRKIMLSQPNDYALAFTSYACDLPVSSSMYDIENYSVPFYQMVLKGYIPFSNLPQNRNSIRKNYVLSLLETGADPSCLLIAEHSDYIRDSRMQWFVNVYKDDFFEDSVEVYEEVIDVLNSVRGETIVDYSTDGKRSRTVYSNGITVEVDYTDKTYSVSEEN